MQQHRSSLDAISRGGRSRLKDVSKLKPILNKDRSEPQIVMGLNQNTEKMIISSSDFQTDNFYK